MRKNIPFEVGGILRLFSSKALFVFLLAFLMSFSLKGQASLYSFSASSGTYTPLSGGTAVTFSAGTSPYLDEAYYNGIPIGFSFVFSGTSYTHAHVSTNGLATLGTSATNNTLSSTGLTNSFASGTYGNPILAPLWDDLAITNNSSDVSYQTTGTAGSRVFTIQYSNVKWQYDAAGAVINFQIQLYEGTNVIKYVYLRSSTGISNGSASIGISNSTSSYLSVGTNVTVAGATASNSTNTTTISSKPANNTVFTFTPPSPCTTPTAQPTSLTIGTNTASSIAGSFTAATGAPSGYLVVRSTGTLSANPSDGSTYTAGQTLGNGTVVQSGTSTSFSASSLNSNTDYTITVFSYNSGTCSGGPKYNVTSALTGTMITCAAAATGLSATSATSSGATFSWTSPAGSNAGTITSALNIYSNSSYTTLVTSVNNVTSSYTLSSASVNPGTTYYYRVVNTNAGGCATSADGGSFTTACTATNVPYTQNFDSVTQPAIPSCMTVLNSNSDTYTWTTCTSTSLGNSTAVTPNSGTNQIGIRYNSSAAMNDWLVLPGINMSSGTSYRLSFYARGYTALIEKFEVKYGTSATAAAMTNAIASSTSISGGTAYTKYTYDFTPSSTGVYYIGIHGISDSNQWYLFVDDISVDVSPSTCTTPSAQPTALTFGTTTATSIAGSYTGVASPNTPSGYMVVRSKSSTAPTAPSNGTSYAVGSTALGANTYVVQNGTATTFTDSGLTSNTQYYYYIYSYNSGCTGQPYYLTTSPLTGSTYTCLSAPTSNAATAVSATGFTANWASLTGATGYLLDVSTVNTFASFVTGYNGLAVAGTSQAITGLSSSTTYYYRVRATNATSCTSVNSATQTVVTLCTSQNVPYTEDFNSTTGTALPSCTSAVNAGSGNIWATDASPGANGFSSRVLKYTYNSSTANTWFFTKGLNLNSGTTYRLTFKYNNNSSSYTEKLKVAYGTSASVAGMATTLADYPSITGGASTASTATIDFTPSATGVYYMGFQAYSAANQYYLFVDDISVDVAPPAITVSPSSPNICAGGSVSLAASSTGSYTYTWSPAAGLSATTGATVTASPTVTTMYTVTGTNGGVSNTKTVTVTVNPVPATIGINDTVSPAAADACATDYVKLDVTGITPIYAINETFDGATPATGWYVYNESVGGTTTNADWSLVPSPYTNSYGTTMSSPGNNKFIISDSYEQGYPGTSGYTVTGIYLPVVDTRGYANLSLSFDQYFRFYTNPDEAAIWVSTNGTNWTKITSYTSNQGTASNFANAIVNLDAYINQPTLYINFEYYSYYGYWWALDNVKVFGNQKVSWTPATGLYTNTSLTTPYTAGTNATTLYAAPSGSQSYTATSFFGAGGACDKTASKTVTRNKYDFKGTTTDWATASNWFPAVVPDANKCVNIPAGKTVEINSAATAKSITLDAAGQLTIKADHSLTVADALTINNNAAKDNFVIETGGNLLQTSTAANDPAGGHVKVERTVNDIKNNPATTGMSYLFWSSPVSGQITKGSTGFSPGTPNNRFYEYYETTDTFKETGDGTFVPGKGYAVRAETSGVTSSTYNKTYKFTGVANNGDISIVLKRTKDSGVNTGSGIGYNLVGNPYPSAINLTKLFAANSGVIENLAYFWTNNVYTATQLGAGYSNYSSNNYAVFNGLGGNPATSAANGDNTTPDGIVAVGQGFIVQAKNKNTSTTPTAANTLVFKNSYSPGNDLRVATASHFFSKQEEIPVNRFWIKLISPAELSNTQLIGYIAGATNGFEEKFDAEDISGGSDLFYSVLGNKQLLIQGRSEVFDVNDIVPVGANFFKDGVYSIALDKGEGIFGSTQKIYLRDKLLNKYHDLTQGAYSFSAAKGNNDTRFEIVYKENTLQSNEAVKSYFDVYKDGISYTVRSSHHLGKVMVYDTSGKLIKMLDVKSHSAKIDLSAAPEGVYIIKAENSGDPKTKKLINTK